MYSGWEMSQEGFHLLSNISISIFQDDIVKSTKWSRPAGSGTCEAGTGARRRNSPSVRGLPFDLSFNVPSVQALAF